MNINLNIPPDVVKAIAAELANVLENHVKKLAAETVAANDTSTSYTVKEVAERLKICKKTVLSKIEKGYLNAADFGTSDRPTYRISKKDLEDYYKNNSK